MAGQVELEQMVVKLVGDANDYQKMVDTAIKSTTEMGAKVEQQLPKIDGLGKQMNALGKSMLGWAAALGVTTGVWKSFEKFEDAERGAMRLNAAIEANGRVASVTAADYAAFGKEMGAVTTTSKGAVMAMAQQLETMGISGEAAKRAIKNAVSLAAAKGGEAESYLRVTAALEEGHAEMLGRYLPTLKDIEDDTEKAAKAQQMLASMFKLAEIEGQSTSAQIERMKKSFSGISKDVGGFVAQGITPLIAGLQKAVDLFNSFDPSVKSTIAGLIAFTAASYGVISAISLVSGALVAAKVNVIAFTTAFMASPIGLVALGIAGATAALYGMSSALGKVTGDADKMNKALEESNRLNKEIKDIQSKRTSDIQSRLSGIEDIQERKDAIQKEIDQAQKELDGARKNKAALDKTIEKGFLAGIGRKVGGTILGGLGLGDAVKEEEEKMTAASKSVEEFAGRLSKLQQMMSELDMDRQAKKLDKSVEELERKLADEIVMMGKSNDEIERRKLKIEGATEAELALADALIKQKKAAEEQKKVTDEADAFVKSLQDQAATFNMTEREATIYRLGLRNAGDDILDLARDLDRLRTSQEKQKELMDKSKETIKEFRTPQEKFTDRIQELNDMLKVSGDSFWPTYQRAVKAAEDELLKAGNTAEKVSGKFDAAAFGSAEALTRLADQQDKLKRSTDQMLGPSGLTAGGAQAVRQVVEQRVGGTVGVDHGNTQVVTLLGQIRDILRDKLVTPTVDLDIAGL